MVIKVKKITLLIIAFVLFLVGCSSNGTNSTRSYENISTDEAQSMIAKKEVDIIDVRTPEEFASGHVPEAVNLPLQDLESRVFTLDKNKSYLIVCRSGNRSGQASEILVSKGFSHIYNMEGGMNQWKGEVAN